MTTRLAVPLPVLVCIIIIMLVLVVPVSGAMGTAMNARDLTGTNIDAYRATIVNSAQECASLCDTIPECVGATYVLPNTIQGPDGHCWPKSAVTGNVENANCISFTKLKIVPITGCVPSNPNASFEYAVYYNDPFKESPWLWEYCVPSELYLYDKSSGAKTWSWDFGDGSTPSTEKNPPMHIYSKSSQYGNYYTVTLTVTGECPGETDTKTLTIGPFFENMGLVKIYSLPAGTHISIDNVERQIIPEPVPKTPYQWPLTPGNHSLRITLDEYKDYSKTVFIESRRIHSISPVLEKGISSTATAPVSTTASSIVTSPSLTSSGQLAPTQAAVQNPPQAAGTTSAIAPAALAVPTGTGITAPSVPVSAGTGTLTVRSTPAGANIYLDGEKVGLTPFMVRDVKAGSHRLLLTLPGYGDISQTVDITAGTDKEVSADFSVAKKTPGFGARVSFAAFIVIILVMAGRKKP